MGAAGRGFHSQSGGAPAAAARAREADARAAGAHHQTLPLVHDVPLQLATPESVRRYGNLFGDWDSEECRLVPWPAPGKRPVVDGLGGGTTEGTFTLQWRRGAHFASNTGVADGDYCFAWTNPGAACAAAASGTGKSGYELYQEFAEQEGGEQQRLHAQGSAASGPGPQAADGDPEFAHLFTEINIHACGSQLFHTVQAPVIVMLALPPPERAPDNVLPSDFEAFWCPAGVGLNVDAMVFHSPPIAVRPTGGPDGDGPVVVMQTKQGAVHSKIYYDPLEEHGVLLRVPLQLDDAGVEYS